jgi:hypothetical protein
MTEQPGYAPDRVLRGISLPRRIGYAFVCLGGLTGAALIATLWLTEPAPLPMRTQLAFAALVAVGLTWAAFSAWALVRRPLFALDRVITATLAVCFSTLTTIGTVAVAAARSSTAGVLTAAAVGLTLIAAAMAMLIRARAYRAALMARKHELEEPAPATRASLPPIGPLALAMRHHYGTASGRRIVIAAVILCLALAAGIALLMIG